MDRYLDEDVPDPLLGELLLLLLQSTEEVGQRHALYQLHHDVQPAP